MNQLLRKEVKYVIGAETALSLQASLEGMLHKDSNAGPGGVYTVRSQYFDSFIDRDLMDNLDGLMEKRKIRTRVYNLDGDTAKLEYKCKSGSDGLKKVINITREQAVRLEQGDVSFLRETDDEFSLFLYQKMEQYIYRPKSIIEYDRTAFTYPVSDTRITFDRNVRVATSPVGIFRKDASFIPLTDEDSVVFEVKYNDFLIEPIKEQIKRVGLLEMANSKYSQARMSYI